MNLNKKTFFRSVSVLILLFALTFSSNVLAASPIASSSTSNLIKTTADLNMAPAKIHVLTFGFLNDLRDFFRGKKKKRNNGPQNTHRHSRWCGHNPPSGGNTGGGTDSVPLDGGLGILALGAAAIGVRKLRSNKHDKI